MTDRDDLILKYLVEVKEDVATIKETTARQDKCIDDLIKDVESLKQSRDIVVGGWKVFVIIGTGFAAVTGYVSANIDRIWAVFK